MEVCLCWPVVAEKPWDATHFNALTGPLHFHEHATVRRFSSIDQMTKSCAVGVFFLSLSIFFKLPAAAVGNEVCENSLCPENQHNEL